MFRIVDISKLMLGSATTLLLLTVSTSAYAGPRVDFSTTSPYSVNGWYWLSEAQHSATWFFKNYDNPVCTIPVQALVTQTSNGGGGHFKQIALHISSGDNHESANLLLIPLSDVVTMDDSWRNPGEGYETGSVLILSRFMCDRFRFSGELKIEYSWEPDDFLPCCKWQDHHLGVNAGTFSVADLFSTAAAGSP